jgi:hypothetical protein
MKNHLEYILIQGKCLKEWKELIPYFTIEELYRISSEGGSLGKLHCDLLANNW